MYADFGSGKIWALRYDKGFAPENLEIVSKAGNISAFGVNEKDELYTVDYGGSILRFK